MIRVAGEADIAAIADTYTELLVYEQEHGSNSNWKLGVYPTIAVPKRAVPAGTMYVLEEEGEVCGSMILNYAQAKEYADVPWQYPAEGEEVWLFIRCAFHRARLAMGMVVQWCASPRIKQRALDAVLSASTPMSIMNRQRGFI